VPEEHIVNVRNAIDFDIEAKKACHLSPEEADVEGSAHLHGFRAFC